MRVKIDKHDQKVLDENDCGTEWSIFKKGLDPFSTN